MKRKVSKEEKLIKKLEKGFSTFFGNREDCKFFISPSSIILIGDHTQYNDGIMISATLDSYIGFCIRPTEDNFSIVVNDKKYSANSLSDIVIDSDSFIRKSFNNLLVRLANEDFELKGFECYIQIDASKVFGLGNFAALNIGFLKAVNSVTNLHLTNQELADFVIASDKELYGPVVGNALYYSVLNHKPNTLMYYDTRSDYKRFLPFDDNLEIIICNSNIPKENFSERCNERIQECEVGVKGLRLYIWGIKNLRDVEAQFLERHIHMLPKRLYMRCLYHVNERQIVEEAYKNLKDKEYEEFGEKLNRTHTNLSEVYEISSPTMDHLVKIAEDSGLSVGSKMISCSYHDSSVNFVRKKNEEKFKKYIFEMYSLSNGSQLEIETYSLSRGIQEVKKTKKTASA